MNKKEAITLMRNEKNCILKADTCDRDCSKCELVRKTEDLLSAYDLAIQALEQEPCEDAISRSETIKYLNTNMAWYDEDGEITDSDEKLKAITDLINGVPSVTPVREKDK